MFTGRRRHCGEGGRDYMHNCKPDPYRGTTGQPPRYATGPNIMGNLIVLDIQLNAIRSFLTTVVAAASLEYSKIQSKSDAGEFDHYDDKENALFYPMMWEEIACKAALG